MGSVARAAQATSQNVDGRIGVFVLDPDGPCRLAGIGWRGVQIFAGDARATPAEVARETSQQLGLVLDVHAVVHAGNRKWIVLRRSVRHGATFER